MDQPKFSAPGPGRWDLDLTHFDGGTTPIVVDLMETAFGAVYTKAFAEIGVPAKTIDFRYVHGFAYTRMVPLVFGDRPSKSAPPAFAVKLLSRLHPEFRRRTKRAEKSLASPPWDEVVDGYYNGRQAELETENAAIQAVVLGDLDDTQLALHFESVIETCRHRYREHFELHVADLGSIARMVDDAKAWGISPAEIVGAMSGASPHTSEPARLLADLRDELGGAAPTSLDDVRATSARADELLSQYMDRQGWVIYTRYDVDGLTLAESPEVLLATISGSSVRARTVDHEVVIDDLRTRVPEADRSAFDELVASTRRAMGMRDAQGPLTIEWPTGLLRRVLLEIGQRAEAAGHLDDMQHVFSLTATQVASLMRRPSVSATAASDAHRNRLESKSFTPPRTLGPEEPAPPLDALPEPLARLTSMIAGVIEELGLSGVVETESAGDVLEGLGIGAESFVGRARVATEPEVALQELQPGEILVTLTTSPAYNLVLTMVGGLVTAEGGPVCHAAVLSRELGLPAVIGARLALEQINTGDLIEIDPVSGTVRVVEPAIE